MKRKKMVLIPAVLNILILGGFYIFAHKQLNTGLDDLSSINVESVIQVAKSVINRRQGQLKTVSTRHENDNTLAKAYDLARTTKRKKKLIARLKSLKKEAACDIIDILDYANGKPLFLKSLKKNKRVFKLARQKKFGSLIFPLGKELTLMSFSPVRLYGQQEGVLIMGYYFNKDIAVEISKGTNTQSTFLLHDGIAPTNKKDPTSKVAKIQLKGISGPIRSATLLVNSTLVNTIRQSTSYNVMFIVLSALVVLSFLIPIFLNFLYRRELLTEAYVKLAETMLHNLKNAGSGLSKLVERLNPSNVKTIKPLLNHHIEQRLTKTIKILAAAKREKMAGSKTLQKTSTEMVAPTILSIIEEKQSQYEKYSHIEIEDDLNEKSYGIFCKVNLLELRAVLANLIDNAVEAIKKEGTVTVSLSKTKLGLTISVSDTGQGINDEIKDKIFDRNFTSGKDNGQGLGLSHARNAVRAWGGEICFVTDVGTGTTFTIELPTSSAPKWYQPKLQLSPQSTVIIVDDDESVHMMWEEKLKSISNKHAIQLTHLYSAEEFLSWHKKAKTKRLHYLYLIDYELGSSQNGIDLIKQLKIEKHSTLVTGLSERESLRKACIKSAIKLVPKAIIAFLPVVLKGVKNAKHA